jgi:hypothetical protein
MSVTIRRLKGAFPFLASAFVVFALADKASAQYCDDYCTPSSECRQACYSRDDVEINCGEFGSCDYCGRPALTGVTHVGNGEMNGLFACFYVEVKMLTYDYPEAWPGMGCRPIQVCDEDIVAVNVPGTCCQTWGCWGRRGC